MTAHFALAPLRSKKIRASAQGQNCTLCIPGVCDGNTETVVLCHLNGADFGKGMGQKAHDIAGFHGCAKCHQYYDLLHATAPVVSDEVLQRLLLRAVIRTWLNLIQREIIKVPLDPEPLPMLERPVKPRKPKGQRTKIQGSSSWPAKGARKIQSANNLRRRDK